MNPPESSAFENVESGDAAALAQLDRQIIQAELGGHVLCDERTAQTPEDRGFHFDQAALCVQRLEALARG